MRLLHSHHCMVDGNDNPADNRTNHTANRCIRQPTEETAVEAKPFCGVDAQSMNNDLTANP